MKESYREGVANHPGPEPCEDGREAALEALDRGNRRQDIELRNQPHPGADAVRVSGRQHENGRPGKSALDPAESKTPGMRRNSTRGFREQSCGCSRWCGGISSTTRFRATANAWTPFGRRWCACGTARAAAPEPAHPPTMANLWRPLGGFAPHRPNSASLSQPALRRQVPIDPR